jgi:dTDP-L-rhamnose 4-epimerase
VNILITGGAGFIGSHLADALIDAGHFVRALDALVPQVHGRPGVRPAYLHPAVELDVGDVRDAAAVSWALRDIDVVYHFAATVGVGQSMYEIANYASVNSLGTAVLLEALIQRPVRRLVVASSMSVYGEGMQGQHGAEATPEDHPCDLRSVYALTKYDQERLCLTIGRAYGIPTTALRFFNVYGPRQALSNPYTGVIAIFASRLLSNLPPLIYEDGLQSRDFVSVYDVTSACVLALTSPATGVFNVGTGRAFTVLDIAEVLAKVLGKTVQPIITGQRRAGDVRHCFADIRAARDQLGYKPCVPLYEGLEDLAAWLREQGPVGAVQDADAELAKRGLVA